MRQTHSRSISMPLRRGTYEEDIEGPSDSDSGGPSQESTDPSSSVPTADVPPSLPEQPLMSPDQAPGPGPGAKRPSPQPIVTHARAYSGYEMYDTQPNPSSILGSRETMVTPVTATPASSGPGGRPSASTHKGTFGTQYNSTDKPTHKDTSGTHKPTMSLLNPRQPSTSPQRQDSGGWWDVVSAVDHSNPAPWHDPNHSSPSGMRNSTGQAPRPASPPRQASPAALVRGAADRDRRMSVSSRGTTGTGGTGGTGNLASPGLPLPPGAEPATIQDLSGSYANFLDLDLEPPPPFSETVLSTLNSSPMRGHGSSHSFGSASVRSVDSGGSPRRLPIRAYAQPQPQMQLESSGRGDGSPTRPGFAGAYHSHSSSSPHRLGASPRRMGESVDHTPRNREASRGRPGHPNQRSHEHSDNQQYQSGGPDAHSSEMTPGASASSGNTSGMGTTGMTGTTGTVNFSRPTFASSPQQSPFRVTSRESPYAPPSLPSPALEPSLSSDLGLAVQMGLYESSQPHTPSSLVSDPMQDVYGGMRTVTGTPPVHDGSTPIWAQQATSPSRAFTASPNPAAASTNRAPTTINATAPIFVPAAEADPRPTLAPPLSSAASATEKDGGKSHFFSRSLTLTLASKTARKDKDKDKDMDRNKENETGAGGGGLGGASRINIPGSGRQRDKDKEKEKEKVSNKPGQWNRDMVAGIMGRPAERRGA